MSRTDRRHNGGDPVHGAFISTDSQEAHQQLLDDLKALVNTEVQAFKRKNHKDGRWEIGVQAFYTALLTGQPLGSNVLRQLDDATKTAVREWVNHACQKLGYQLPPRPKSGKRRR